MNCIIFDFDGTLADTQKGIIATFNKTFKRLGLPAHSEDEISSTIGMPLHDAFMLLSSLSSEEADAATDIYREIFFKEAINEMTLFPGVLETLKALSERGVEMAIASSRGEGSLIEISHNLGIDRYISAQRTYGAEKVSRHKPAPDLVLLIMKDMGVDASSTLVVGDTTFDIEMGGSAGCRSCAVTYGNHTAAKLATANPTYIIERITDLLDIRLTL